MNTGNLFEEYNWIFPLLGIKRMHILVFLQLVAGPEIFSSQQYADQLGIQSGNYSRYTKALQDKGLIVKDYIYGVKEGEPGTRLLWHARTLEEVGTGPEPPKPLQGSWNWTRADEEEAQNVKIMTRSERYRLCGHL